MHWSYLRLNFTCRRIYLLIPGRILGRGEAPVAYRSRGKDYVEASGINFAVAGAGVRCGAKTLAQQIDDFGKMVYDGTVGKWQLKNSVALVAISGNDYARVTNNTTDDEASNYLYIYTLINLLQITTACDSS